MESILTSIKKMLGIIEEYEQFDADLIMHINSVFMILNQIGVGPSRGFSIKGEDEVWIDFIPDDSRLGSIKLLIDKPVKTKCFLAYRTIKLQVSKPLLKCSQQGKFGICSNTHLHHPPAHYIYGKRPSPGRTSPLCPLPKRPLPF